MTRTYRSAKRAARVPLTAIASCPTRRARDVYTALLLFARDDGVARPRQETLAVLLGEGGEPCSTRTIQRGLVDLEHAGLIRREGTRRERAYHLVDIRQVSRVPKRRGDPAAAICSNCRQPCATGARCATCKQFFRADRVWQSEALALRVEDGKEPLAIYAALYARGHQVHFWGARGDVDDRGDEGLVPFLVRMEVLPRVWLDRRREALRGDVDGEHALPRP